METYDHDATINAAITAQAAGEFQAAADFARQATEKRPDDAESWSLLGLALASTQPNDAESALRKAINMEPEQPRWLMHLGGAFLRMERAEEAQPVLAKAAELSRGHPEAMTLWGDSLMAMSRFGDAAQVYGRALQSEQSTRLWTKAGDALMAAGDTINAAQAYERAHPPGQRPVGMTAKLADLHITLSHYEQAAKYNEEVLRILPDNPDAGLRAANLLRWRGHHEEALEIEKSFWKTHKTHAGLIAALLDDKDETPLEQALKLIANETVPAVDRRKVGFALARYFDRQGDMDRAWQQADAANALYDAPFVNLDREKAWLEKSVKQYATLEPPSSIASKLIYIMGPPRCGGSLLQNVLARCEGVRSVGERGALISWLVAGLDQPNGLSDQLAQLSQADIVGMASASGIAKTYVDKASPHILFAGLLDKIHPGAKFIVPQRDPADMAVSMYFHDFPDEFLYTRSIKGISDYLELQSHAIKLWRDVGLDLISHDHDAFVADPAVQGEALFTALGLPWSEQLLESGPLEGAVTRTFSARQVTGGISQKYQGRGQRYAQHLKASGFNS